MSALYSPNTLPKDYMATQHKRQSRACERGLFLHATYCKMPFTYSNIEYSDMIFMYRVFHELWYLLRQSTACRTTQTGISYRMCHERAVPTTHTRLLATLNFHLLFLTKQSKNHYMCIEYFFTQHHPNYHILE